MKVSQDYEDLFKILNTYKIRYLVVGAHAFMYYAEPRLTKDIDVWIMPDLNDPMIVYQALQKFGAPMRDISLKDLQNKKLMIQLGVAPVRIDIMMGVPGLHAKSAWKNRKKTRYGKTPIWILGAEDLIVAKKKAGRPHDKTDIQILKDRLRRKKNRPRASLSAD